MDKIWNEVALEARDTFFKVKLGRTYITTREWLFFEREKPPLSLPLEKFGIIGIMLPDYRIDIEALDVEPLACMLESKYRRNKNVSREEILKYAIECIRDAAWSVFSG